MPGLPYIILACVAISIFFHANLNQYPFFDTIWACACYLETAAMLPQLWMFSHVGVDTEAMTSHFVALTALARACSLFFWFLAFEPRIMPPSFAHSSEMVII